MSEPKQDEAQKGHQEAVANHPVWHMWCNCYNTDPETDASG
jgi:hypothetical protein